MKNTYRNKVKAKRPQTIGCWNDYARSNISHLRHLIRTTAPIVELQAADDNIIDIIIRYLLKRTSALSSAAFKFDNVILYTTPVCEQEVKFYFIKLDKQEGCSFDWRVEDGSTNSDFILSE